MRALRLHGMDGLDALALEDVPRPEPATGELLVDVRAAGVNPLDWLICRGVTPHLLDRPLPWTPGWDCSGVVESVGDGVTGVAPGDDVYGMVRLPGAGGTFAEYATMSVEEVEPKPDTLSHTEAAGAPMVGQTAYHALFEAADLGAGDRVLVHAAAGGVGHMAVQFAAAAGAHVVGTASERNESYLRALGVDEFVNYRTEHVTAAVEPVDIVLDTIGGEVLDRAAEVTRPGGVVVTLPEPPSDDLADAFEREHGVAVRFFSVTDDADPGLLGDVSDRLAAGTRPTISETYPLSEARATLEESAAGHVRGKLVLEP